MRRVLKVLAGAALAVGVGAWVGTAVRDYKLSRCAEIRTHMLTQIGKWRIERVECSAWKPAGEVTP